MKQIKIALKDIKPNPFKKEIDKGRLNEEQVEKLVEGYRQTTFHENLLARKTKDGEVQLVYGHHRLEAAKRVYGPNHEIMLNIVDYSDEQMIIDMCRENLTQRGNEFRNEADAVMLAKKYLEGITVQHLDSNQKKERGYHGHVHQEVGARQIAEFLSKEGKTVSKSKVATILKMEETLAPDIKERVMKFKGMEDQGDHVTMNQAVVLSEFKNHDEQRDLEKAMKKSKDKLSRNMVTNVHKYKEASPEVQEKVRKGKADLADIDVEILYDHKKFVKDVVVGDKKKIKTARMQVDRLIKSQMQFVDLWESVRKNWLAQCSDEDKKRFRILTESVIKKLGGRL